MCKNDKKLRTQKLDSSERKRIAQVLHDTIIGNLALIKLILRDIHTSPLSDPTHSSIDDISSQVDVAITHIHDLISELNRPSD